MANNDYQHIAIGDIGTQVFWFNKDVVSYALSAGADFTVAIDAKTYLAKVDYAASTVFTYASSGSTWKIGADAVTLAEYGITVTGTADNSETITVSYAGGAFEYAVPVTAGAEFGGDTESFDAPETDLEYVPKISGRTTLNDISYTINYTAEKYKRILAISDDDVLNTYMEVFSDGSATIFKGTCGRPTITSGDVRQITWTIVPQFMLWVGDIYNLTADEKGALSTGMYVGNKVNVDVDTIPSYRPEYYTAKNA